MSEQWRVARITTANYEELAVVRVKFVEDGDVLIASAMTFHPDELDDVRAAFDRPFLHFTLTHQAWQ